MSCRQGLASVSVRFMSHLHSTVDHLAVLAQRLLSATEDPVSRWNQAVSRSLVAGLRHRPPRQNMLRGLNTKRSTR